MKYFKNSKNKIFAFDENGRQDHLINKDLAQVSDKELSLILNPPLSLGDVKSQKVQALSDAVSLKIQSSFESNALGPTHVYPSKEIDQLNLTGLVSINIDAPYVCEDPEGIWNKRLHTSAQLKKVAVDGEIRKLALLDKFQERRDVVENATTIEQVNAVSETY